MEEREELGEEGKNITQKLPLEIVSGIFSFLSNRDLLSVMGVNRIFKSVVGNNHFWKERYSIFFRDKFLEAKKQENSVERSENFIPNDWKTLYKTEVEKAFFNRFSNDQLDFYRAFYRGDLEVAKKLASQQDFVFDPLRNATRSGYIFQLPGFLKNKEMQKWLFENFETKIENWKNSQWTTLHWAILCRQEETVKEILTREKDFMNKIKLSYCAFIDSPLHLAVWVNHFGILKFLVANGFDYQYVANNGPGFGEGPLNLLLPRRDWRFSISRDDWWGKPLNFAVEVNNVEMVRVMLQHPHLCEKELLADGIDAPFCAAVRKGNMEIIRLFINEIRERKKSGRSVSLSPIALGHAIEHHQFKTANLIMDEVGFNLRASQVEEISGRGWPDSPYILRSIQFVLNNPKIDLKKIVKEEDSSEAPLYFLLIKEAIRIGAVKVLCLLLSSPKIAFSSIPKEEKGQLLLFANEVAAKERTWTSYPFEKLKVIECLFEYRVRISDIAEKDKERARILFKENLLYKEDILKRCEKLRKELEMVSRKQDEEEPSNEEGRESWSGSSFKL